MQWKRALISGVTTVTLVGWSFAGGSPARAAASSHHAPKPTAAPRHAANQHVVKHTFKSRAFPKMAVVTPLHVWHVNVFADGTEAAGSYATETCETVSGNGACTLRAATQLANANGTLDEIDLPAGTYTLTRPNDNSGSDAFGSLKLTDTGGVVIKGTNAVIDGAGTSDLVNGYGDNILTVPDGDLVTSQISGVTFQNGNGGTGSGLGVWGGAIFNGDSGTMVLNNVVVTKNTTGDDTSCGCYYDGGGIFNVGNLSISNSTVSWNTADGGGGGIEDSADNTVMLQIANSHIDHNTATNYEGGGLSTDNGNWDGGYPDTQISSTTFNGNSALDDDGGGAYLNGESNTLSNDTFNGNYAYDNGGGLWEDSMTTLTNSVVDGNTTGTDESGAGIYADWVMTLDGDVISNNIVPGTSGYGGGLYDYDQVSATNTEFRNNFAYYGGGVYVESSYNFSGDSLLFDSNDTGYAADEGEGGGIYVDGSATLSNSRFTQNTAEYGGAVYNNSNLGVSSSVFKNNQAVDYGGALYNDSEMTLSNSVVQLNSVWYDGGGLYNNSSLVSTHNIYDSNTVSGDGDSYGGGVENEDSFLSNWDAFTNNRASTSDATSSGYGGGIYNDSYPFQITNGLISGNSVTGGAPATYPGYGGGLYNDDDANLTNVTVANNTANDSGGYGGGIYNNSYPLSLTFVTVAGNSAGLDGGGVYSNDQNNSEVTTRGSVFAQNSPTQCSSDVPGDQLISGGYNLSTGTCGLNGPNDIINGTADLLPLAGNGGPTWTMALGPASQARNTGGNSCPTTDQRGIVRPQGSACDRGAYEQLASPAGNSRFVARLYNDLLNRNADSGGLAHWTGLLDSGHMTRTGVASAFLAGDEYRGVLVKSWYAAYLNRQPGATALAAWVAGLHSGATSENTRASLLASGAPAGEYYGGHGGGTDALYVDALYRDVVGRQVLVGGPAETNWVSLIGSTSRLAVTQSIVRQPESLRYLVNGWYNSFLHRNGGSSVTSFAASIQGGATDASVITAIVGSGEYWTYAQTH